MTPDPKTLESMTLGDLIGNARDRVGIARCDVQGRTQRSWKQTDEVLARASELLREAEKRAKGRAAELNRISSEVLQEAREELTIERELADALDLLLTTLAGYEAKSGPLLGFDMAVSRSEDALRKAGRL
jgi:hypothetical protein